MPQKTLLDRAKQLYYSLSALRLSGSAGGYEGLGGGVAFGAGFDPKTGRIGFSAGLNVGVGVSFSIDGSTSAAAGGSIPNGVSASVGVNASVRVPGYRFGANGTLIDPSGFKPRFSGVSGGFAPGAGLTANANLTARGSAGVQVLPSCQ